MKWRGAEVESAVLVVLLFGSSHRSLSALHALCAGPACVDCILCTVAVGFDVEGTVLYRAT